MGRLAKNALNVASVSGLRDHFSGEIVLPGDPEYDRSRVVLNTIADHSGSLVDAERTRYLTPSGPSRTSRCNR